tara:strand:- start:199 stop:384 length:186 start_codon:yes stop_codon:yes gene_type:complete
MVFFVLSDSIHTSRHDNKEKPMWRYGRHLKIEPEEAIFAKKCIFQMNISEEDSTSTWVYLL